ncbi:FAD-binding oxidoreductase [Nocardiopsis sp. FIRDI 009]|uniref:NAD(P)/FAD-dependent oxidoreductase n=1 Tax=Nocardiopsis sp. FIRDI 009 TaxID=714197 RepID=UPI000E262198|nr:FAD-dependent oxidoreductase [Nocardiopsis sp. FIRDI 009]
MPAGEMGVLVVGAGVAGLNIAHQLRRRGVDVAVVDSRHPGAGASHGNAGWVNPAQAGPLPDPVLLGDALRAFRDPDAPLRIAPDALPLLSPWFLRFLRNCTRARHARGARALAALGTRALPLLDQLAEDGVEFTRTRTDFLAVAREPEAVRAYLGSLEPLREAGFDLPTTALDGDRLREIEPALSDRVRAGALLRDHVQTEPASLVAGLTAHLRAGGVPVEEGVAVTDVRTRGGVVDAVRTTAGERPVGALVVATGAKAAALTTRLGRRVPVVGGRGYSFDVPVERLPRASTLLLDAHVACAPMSGRLRVSGGMDFGRGPIRPDPARIDAITRGAAPMIVGADWTDRRHAWAGERPLTPDGLPVVDRLPGYANAYVATGYSMLGLTLSAPAAEALAAFLVEGARPAVLEPFRADRFGARRH